MVSNANKRIRDYTDEELTTRVQKERLLVQESLEVSITTKQEEVKLARPFVALLVQTLAEVEVRLHGRSG